MKCPGWCCLTSARHLFLWIEWRLYSLNELDSTGLRSPSPSLFILTSDHSSGPLSATLCHLYFFCFLLCAPQLAGIWIISALNQINLNDRLFECKCRCRCCVHTVWMLSAPIIIIWSFVSDVNRHSCWHLLTLFLLFAIKLKLVCKFY